MFALTARNEKTLSQLDNNELGLFGEAYVASILKRNGYIVSHTATVTRNRGDLRIIDTATGETHLIEVKTARKHHFKSRWEFCLNKSIKTKCTYSDIIVFLCIDDHENIFIYVCPAGFYSGTAQACICSHPIIYSGKLAIWRQQKETINIESMHATASLLIGRVQ